MPCHGKGGALLVVAIAKGPLSVFCTPHASPETLSVIIQAKQQSPAPIVAKMAKSLLDRSNGSEARCLSGCRDVHIAAPP